MVSMRTVILLALLSASCSVDQTTRKNQGCECDDYFAKRQTKAQGVSAARQDIREKGFRIIRYDMPVVRTGYWEPYQRNFRHFGIEETNDLFSSMEFCRAYNGEMDRQLLLRYGDGYRRLRSRILPKPDAERFLSL